MKFSHLLHNKKLIIFIVLFFSSLVVYLILRVLVFGSDPLIPFLTSLLDSYLLLSERFANHILLWIGSDASIMNHGVFVNEIQQYAFISEIILKKSALILILLFWVTRSSLTLSKIYFTLVSLATHYLFVTLYIAFGAHQTTFGQFNESIPAVLIDLGNLSFLLILFLWYKKNKVSILERLNIIRINKPFLDRKINSIVIVFILYVIIIKVLPVYFDFYLWVHLISKSTQILLGLMGIESSIEPFYLFGVNGSLYITSGCLGLKTLFLFASIVYLTGNKNKSRIIYIAAGLVFLNLVNTLRLVFLFKMVQEFGNDTSKINHLHDVYNYIVYFIIFILWIIWFEKFTEIRKKIPHI